VRRKEKRGHDSSVLVLVAALNEEEGIRLTLDELNNYVASMGYDIEEIEIPFRERVGEKKLKLKDGFTIFSRILLDSFLKGPTGVGLDSV
jgi:hypothetical protein